MAKVIEEWFKLTKAFDDWKTLKVGDYQQHSLL